MPLLAGFSIPAPIVGGLLVAIAMILLQLTAGLRSTLETSTKSTLLLIFFASIGLTSNLSLLSRGGPRLVRFLLALFPFLVVQDALSILLAKLLGLHAVLGLVAGSVTLIGGHGTGSAYAERFAADYGILNVMGLTMTSATIGLVIGGIIGGPVAGSLMSRLKDSVPVASATSGGVVGGPENTGDHPHPDGRLVGGAQRRHRWRGVGWPARGSAVTIPSFLWCLLIVLILRDGLAAVGLRLPAAPAELVGSFCLSLFLVWTMMTLDLGSVVSLAGPLLIILVGQTILVVV